MGGAVGAGAGSNGRLSGRALRQHGDGEARHLSCTRQHTFVALPFVRAGATVAVVNYALCPAVTVEDIVRQILQATAWLYRNGANFGAPAGPLYVAGHSAGGHLTAMMLAAQWPKFAADLPP